MKTTESPASSDAFYYKLYLGLFEEASGDVEKAKTWITNAAASDYATGGDYMGDVAIVHAKVRGWISNSTTLVWATVLPINAIFVNSVRALFLLLARIFC